MFEKIPKLVLALVVLAVVIFAAIRVAPFIRNPAAPTEDPETKMIIRAMSSGVVPEYEVATLAENIDDVIRDIQNRAQSALMELPAELRPSESDARQIAEVFARFVRLNRLGDRQEALERYAERGVVPKPVLVQEDQSRADRAWAYSTTWARHAPLNSESIRAQAVYRSGRAVSNPRMEGSPISGREMRSGGFVTLTPHSYSAYEIIINAVVPSRDATSEHPVDICVLIVNDMPRGGWDVAQSVWSGLPAGKIFSLPYP